MVPEISGGRTIPTRLMVQPMHPVREISMDNQTALVFAHEMAPVSQNVLIIRTASQHGMVPEINGGVILAVDRSNLAMAITDSEIDKSSSKGVC